MSQPTFPPVDPDLTRDDVLNMLLASIAMEELGLSHIINAEGEKIQHVLGTLNNCEQSAASVEDALRVNRSVRDLIESATQYQSLLKSKMERVLEYIGPPCPPKPPCPPDPPCPPRPPWPPGCAHCTGAFAFTPRRRMCPGAFFTWEEEALKGRCVRRAPEDCTAILLEPGRLYELSFLANFQSTADCGTPLSIALELACGEEQREPFVYHAPCGARGAPTTLLFAGVFLSTCECADPARLRVCLRARDMVCVEQAQLILRQL